MAHKSQTSRFVSLCCLPGRRFYLQFCVQFCKGEGALGGGWSVSPLPPRWAGITQVRSTGYPVASRSMTSCYSRLKSLSAENMRHKLVPVFALHSSEQRELFLCYEFVEHRGIKQRDHTLVAWGWGLGGRWKTPSQLPRGGRFPPPLLGCHSLCNLPRGGPHSVRNRSPRLPRCKGLLGSCLFPF